MKKIILLLGAIILFFAFPVFQPIHADWIDPREAKFNNFYRSFSPTFFPACPRPRGTTKAFYREGTHGIPGSQQTYTGSDIVYSFNEDNFVQCFCPDNGNTGIQSNWLSINSLSEDFIDNLKKMGWVLVEDGSLWGLSPKSYLTQNLHFSCVRELRDFNSQD